MHMYTSVDYPALRLLSIITINIVGQPLRSILHIASIAQFASIIIGSYNKLL